ncbi:MAG: hypothetical protein L0H53_08435 [Candidatus Nitrosocosmicus sp.]|nr:hypothetical protein [Candidatus Nitrosocosmicus sp.]MDN5867706.1 hypothetical protein [Candidatus Nitrosocosmicus sp.]
MQGNDVKVVNGDNAACENLDGSKGSSNDHQTSQAMNFGNIETVCATKSSNFDEKRRRERDLNSVAILEESKVSD